MESFDRLANPSLSAVTINLSPRSRPSAGDILANADRTEHFQTSRGRPNRAAVDPEAGKPYLEVMAIRPIVTLPDAILRTVSRPVERVDDDLRRLLDDMLETMYDAPGIGLAGIQVAEPIRVLVMDIAKGEDEPKRPIAMVNPEIVKLGGEMRLHEEGCLSIPEVYAEVERPASALVRYIDRDGKPQEMLCEGLLSTVVQHEMDHLDGKLFIDYLSRLKRDMIIKKFKKQKALSAL
jgi:peptide deformylase